MKTRTCVVAGLLLAAVMTFAAEELPLIAFSSEPIAKMDKARMVEARDAGFTALALVPRTVSQAVAALDAAQAAGIKAAFYTDLYKTNHTAFANAIKDHPALLFHYAWDEPNVSLLPRIGQVVRDIQQVDSNHPCVVNLFGRVYKMKRWYGVDSYEEYLSRFLEHVPTPILSFDQYPVLIEGKFPSVPFRPVHGECLVMTNWYHSLETVLAASQSSRKPFWAHACLCAMRHQPDGDNPVPEEGHIRLQQYANLAYGAQGLIYYDYRTDHSDCRKSKIMIHGHALSFDGKRTTVYERVRRVNQELRRRAFVFLGADVKSVRHTGESVPLGVTRLTEKDLPEWVKALETPDGGAVVSRLANGGREYLVVVNRNPERELTLKIKLAKGTKYIRDDGTILDVSLYTDEFWLDPGMAEIFQAPQSAKTDASLPPPTFDSVAYGEHPMQKMDVWLPEKGAPTPAIIFVHGGGFRNGGRKDSRLGERIPKCRAARVALISVEYRLLKDAGDVKPPVRVCMDDVMAAIRFVRSKAKEWNIDTSRIGLTGSSAGAHAVLYASLTGDNEFGIRAVYTQYPQTSIDPKEMREWIPNSKYGARLFGYPDFQTWFDHRAEVLPWIEKFSPAGLLRHCTPSRAPAFVHDGPAAPKPGEMAKDPTHSGTFRHKFAEICAARGIVCRYGHHDALIALLTADAKRKGNDNAQ